MSLFDRVAGTTENTFAVGDGGSGNKSILANTGSATPPFLRWNDSLQQWELSVNGVAATPLAALTATAPVAVTKAVAVVGVAADAARADHKHDVTTAAPAAVGVSTAAAEGTAVSLARSDHSHQSNTAPANVTKAAAAIGTSGEPARADHKHDITTATAGSAAVGAAAAEGTATSMARSDHAHAFTRGTPVSVGTANAAGTSTNFSSADHVHSGLTRDASDFATFTAKAAPTSSDVLLIEDAAAAGAKKQITLGAIPLANTQVLINPVTTITTTSTTGALMTGMTITPAAGTYMVWFSASVGNLSGIITGWIRSGGVAVVGSERTHDSSNTTNRSTLACMATVTVNGAQAIEGYWSVSTGTGSCYNRGMTILKIA